MKKLITSLICFFACAGLQARVTLHQSDFDQKAPIGGFSENTPESHQVQKLYLIESASGELLILAENRAGRKYRARYFDTNLGRFISRDPLGYVDGMGLYNGYFAQKFGMDPKGLKLLCPLKDDCESQWKDKKASICDKHKGFKKWLCELFVGAVPVPGQAECQASFDACNARCFGVPENCSEWCQQDCLKNLVKCVKKAKKK